MTEQLTAADVLERAAARLPAEAFHVGDYIAEELSARGWTAADLAQRMGGPSVGVDELCVEMLVAVRDPNLLLDEELAAKIARGFGVSPDLFLNLDKSWRRALARAEAQ